MYANRQDHQGTFRQTHIRLVAWMDQQVVLARQTNISLLNIAICERNCSPKLNIHSPFTLAISGLNATLFTPESSPPFSTTLVVIRRQFLGTVPSGCMVQTVDRHKAKMN